jgi:hypothetical protein
VTYDDWIREYFTSQSGILLGKCREAVTEMRKAFPELAEVRGHVTCAWGRRGHFWATAPDGTIVDPTRAQFPGPVEYEAWNPGQTVRVGRCMNCGEDIWREVTDLSQVRREEVCGDACSRELEAYFNDPAKRIVW